MAPRLSAPAKLGAGEACHLGAAWHVRLVHIALLGRDEDQLARRHDTHPDRRFMLAKKRLGIVWSVKCYAARVDTWASVIASDDRCVQP